MTMAPMFGVAGVVVAVGIAVGDSILLTLARRLGRLLKPQDTLARLTGDQFAMIVLSERDPTRLIAFAETIRRTLRAPITFNDREIFLTASIGLALGDGQPSRTEETLKDAELAMYHAKRIGGDRMDEAIINYLRRHHNLLIGESTAEKVKTTIGTARMPDDGRGATMMVRGRDLLNGVPKEVELTQAMVAEALAEPIQQICEAVMIALEATPPDLAADIVDRGVMLSGGGAMLGEMDLALREQTGLMISLADQPMSCVALGTGKALEYEKQLRHVIDYDS